MESKIYTAQEVREYADAMAGDFDDSNFKPVEVTYEAGIVIIKCLRHAAEMRERAEELKAQCLKICGRGTCDHKGDKCVCCTRDVIDFIVRGDAVKEVK